jgi:hypothetical protein
VRYVYLGDRLTDPSLIGQSCDPILRADGKCLVGRKPRNQTVRFADGREAVVLARRLRVATHQEAAIDTRQPAGPRDAVRGAVGTGPRRRTTAEDKKRAGQTAI